MMFFGPLRWAVGITFSSYGAEEIKAKLRHHSKYYLFIDLFSSIPTNSRIVLHKRKTTIFFHDNFLRMRKQHWAPIQMKEMLLLRWDLENPDH